LVFAAGLAIACSDLDPLRLQAQLGGVDSQTGLPRRDSEGRGGRQDEAGAFRWYLRAASSGSPDAALVVAGRYLEGVGVERDDAKAVEWFERSAEGENAEAQLRL